VWGSIVLHDWFLNLEKERAINVLTSRLTFVPWQYKTSVLYLDVSGSMRDFDGF
jgi:hypothetical protein